MKINTPSGRICQSYHSCPNPVKYNSQSVYHASLSKYLEGGGGVQMKTTSSVVIYVTISVHFQKKCVNIRNITTGSDSFMYMYINTVLH